MVDKFIQTKKEKAFTSDIMKANTLTISGYAGGPGDPDPLLLERNRNYILFTSIFNLLYFQ